MPIEHLAIPRRDSWLLPHLVVLLLLIANH